MHILIQDLRYGARKLLKNPGFTLIAVLTLALGIGANTAIFSVINGVLLRPLPYVEPQQLVRLFETVERTAMAGDRMEVAPANFLDWRAQTQSFSRLAAYGLTGSVISEGGEAEHLEGALVTADFFSTLGVAPLRGRSFTAEDEAASERRVILGYGVWQRCFGGAEDLIGRVIQLDGFSFTVIGVMPRGFQYPQRTQIYELYRLSPAQRTNFWNQLSARVAALPGVEAVGAIDSLPFSGRARVWRFRRDGEDANAAAGLAASFQVATPDYFRAAGMTLRRGRGFTSGDAEQTPPVAVINETMALRFWPNAEALGQRIFIRNETFAREIVGVVSDLKHFGLDQETQPEMYAPFAQFVIDVMPMIVRVQGDPAGFANAVGREARQVDSTVAIERIAPMRDLLTGSLAARRFTMLLLGAFAAAALLLASVGIYGVMAYSVSERTREIGVRLALGAQTADVLQLVLKQSLTLAAVGVGIGLAASFALARLMKNLLFGVTAHDPLTFLTVAGVLLVAALLACWLPARRATKVDPIVALRYE